MALGAYPAVTLAEARELVLAGQTLLASDIDPMAQRKAKAEAKRQAVTASQREVENSFSRSPGNGGRGGRKAKLHVMPRQSCGDWKRTSSQHSARSTSRPLQPPTCAK